MIYILKHEDDDVAVFSFNEGNFVVSKICNPELLPMLPMDPSQAITTKLRSWLSLRCIPASRQYLNRDTQIPVIDLLIQNLGISLTDHYWYMPSDMSITWKEINPYTNVFESSNLLETIYQQGPVLYEHFSPSLSLEGNLKKKWIIKNNVRYLVKGNINTDVTATNEVFATILHKRQNFNNYVPYEYIDLQSWNKSLRGCMCPCFTDINTELVSAYSILNSYKKPNDVNMFEYFIYKCVEYGCNEQELRKFLDYMYLTDFIRTELNRHGTNFGMLRDSKTLKLIGPCPICDNGNSMLYNNDIPIDNEILNIKIQYFFETTELKMLRHVTDFNCVDVQKLPTENEVFNIYKYLGEHYAESIANVYRYKCLYVKNKLQHNTTVQSDLADYNNQLNTLLSTISIDRDTFIKMYSTVLPDSRLKNKKFKDTDYNKAYVAYCILNDLKY